jgi:hypothetical protein
MDQSSSATSSNCAASCDSTGCFRIYWTTCYNEQKNTMKCITHNCSNHSHQGLGRVICVEPDSDGWICEPCWIFLTKATGRLNSIYENGKRVAEERQRDRDHYYAGQASAQSQTARTLSPGHPRTELPSVETMSSEEDAEFDAIQNHMEDNGTSRLSYGDLVRQNQMDQVREDRLEFENFTLVEKVILKLNGVIIYRGDIYERDACRCSNFACEERWYQANRRWNWQDSPDYIKYLEILEDQFHQFQRMQRMEQDRLRVNILHGH